MADNGRAEDKLEQAIEAARRGDKAAARRLLQQVLTEDRDNERAWMWMASVVDSVDERRACLERALKINPNNARAQEALRRLGGEVPASAAQTPSIMDSLPIRSFRGGGNRTLYFAIAGALGVVLLAIVLLSLLPRGPSDTEVRQTATAFAAAQLPADASQVAVVPTQTRVPINNLPVTRDPEINLLPATFTPTPTSTASPTPPPTATPYPLTDFPLIFTLASDTGQPSLFSINADGVGQQPLASDFGEFPVYSPDGGRIAFIRFVPGTASEEASDESTEASNLIPQLFVAPADDPESARQITQMQGRTMSRPSWTPDGARIVFSSDQDGDAELFIVDESGGAPQQLTNNNFSDTDPAVSRDGQTIVYASDQNTPSSNELYSIPIGGGDPLQLTDATGSSSWPSFSPDGLRIAFVSDRGGDSDIYVMDANGQRPFLVTIDDGDAEDGNPVWTPDGQWIAFVSNRDGSSFQVYLISPDGTTILPVTSGDTNVHSISMKPITLSE